MNDFTYCSANEEVCPMTDTCSRARWRRIGIKNPRQSFADFSEELLREGDSIACPFKIEVQSDNDR